MGLLSRFFKKQPESIDNSETESKPTISRDTFICDDEPTDIRDNLLPIYRVYSYLEVDLETRGYKDALAFPDSAYISIQKTLIKDRIRLEIDKALIEYSDLMKSANASIECYKQLALIEHLQEKRSKIEIYEDHVSLLKKLDSDIINDCDIIKSLFTSYEVGFKRGIVETLSNKK